MMENGNIPDTTRDDDDALMRQENGGVQLVEPLFPPEWEWQNYEEATREFAAQNVVYVYERHDYSDDQNQAFKDKAALWYGEQTDAGNLPSYIEKIEKRELYQKIWEGLIEDTKQNYCTGTLTRGHAHITVEHEDWPHSPFDDRVFQVRKNERDRDLGF